MGTDIGSTRDEQGWRVQAARDVAAGELRFPGADESIDEWEVRMDVARDARAALELGEQHDRACPFIVYRLYDWDLDLAYVGATKDLARRIGQHRDSQRWWHDIDHDVIVTDSFASSDEAADWEATLIAERHPRYNIAGNPGRKHGRYDANRTPPRAAPAALG